eukprot:CAMPEP_0197848796 /NCGR_PEP_ID=MMETSP1438-20131217/10085_1 /TAXON_ID=1461541 /ORGANISM="Pterosperma sp., Strain CCMP1384" /LENGTH=258 /DNA_ID=CAMNT_0043461213 /DNA_START=140 /DNA_END=916 /DNA_ORIENTATION=+
MSRWNNNNNTERGLVDVFATSSYTTIGEKDKPHEYIVPTLPSHWYLPGVDTNNASKFAHRSVFKGKQVAGVPGKLGWTGSQPPEVYLEKKHTWVADGAPFNDRLKYKETQPEKKLGFHSGDFRRKDEFTRVFRTEQYRERLKSEEQCYKKEVETKKAAGLLPTLPPPKEKPAKPFLYDLLDKEEEDYPNKCPRDTKNPTWTSKERDFGIFYPTSQQYGWGVEDEPHTKPQYARIPIVRTSFYSTNLAGKVAHKYETMK